MAIEMTADITLDDIFVDSILITAFDSAYGGSNYWVDNLDDTGTRLKVRVYKKKDETEPLGTKWTAVLLTPEGPDKADYVPVMLNRESLSAAFTKLYNEHKGYIGDYIRRSVVDDDPGDIDADAADCIVQMAVFGDIVYG